MKRLLTTTATCLVLLGSAANAEDTFDRGWYADIDFGAAFSQGEADYIGATADAFGGTPNIDMDDIDAVYGLAAGYDFAGPWRGELELRKRSLSTDSGTVNGLADRSADLFALDGEVESTTLMAVGYYDFETVFGVQPYVKAGIGAAYNEASATGDFALNSDIWSGFGLQGLTISDSVYPDGDTTNFAWELGAGLGVPLSERLTLDLQYQYIDIGDVSTNYDSNGDAISYDDLGAQETTIGLRYKF